MEISFFPQKLSQVFFRILAPASLREIRLCGWTLHIVVYLCLFIIVYRECRSTVMAAGASAVSFFVTFSWPSTLATPNYKSLSTDFLVLHLCLLVASTRCSVRAAIFLRCAAGVTLLAASISYPSLILLVPLVFGFEAREFVRIPGRMRYRITKFCATATVLAAGFGLLVWLWADGAIGRWMARIAMTQSYSLVEVRNRGVAFYIDLVGDIATKTSSFSYYVATTLCLVFAAFFFRKMASGLWLRIVLGIFQFYSIYLIIAQYGGDQYVEHYFFPTAYCLAGVGSIVVFAIAEIDYPAPVSDAAQFAIIASLISSLVYCTSTYFRGYYSTWNSGLLGLPFAVSLVFAVQLARWATNSKILLALAGIALTSLASVAARYNYSGVYRDAEVAKLTATFVIPPLRGIRSSPDRVQAIESLYAYLKPKLFPGEPLLIFDQGPMLYFVLDAKPAYGLAWAVRQAISDSTHEHLVRDLLSNPLPKYAIRIIINPSDISWTHSAKVSYGDEYLLNRTVESRYKVDRLIFPFEVLQLR